MTNDLVKTFFDTFGIEQKYEDGTCDMDDKCRYTDCNTCQRINKFNYPQNTDSIVLQLICILLSNNSPYMFKLGDWDVEKLKDTVLTMCIKLPDFLEWEDTSDNFKHQVRTLFEEG